MKFDIPTLDQITNGVFGAMTSSERSARVRLWLETQPSADHLQAVFKELSARDKGASRPVRERLDEIRKTKSQETLAEEWAQKAHSLLSLNRMNMADGMAWQRDAAKAGAPLSKEPLASLKTRLAHRVAQIEELEHQVAVQREAAALFTQRLDTLSTQPLSDVLLQLPILQQAAQEWQDKSAQLPTHAAWADVDAKLPLQLQAAQAQLNAIWGAFFAALNSAQEALQDTHAALPSIPVWADEIRAARQAHLALEKSASAAKSQPVARAKIDPAQRAAANAVIEPILKKLEEELAAGHGRASSGAANNLRKALREQGAWIDAKLDLACHNALGAAGELEAWQRWRADQLRQGLVEQAETLRRQPLSGRKQQEQLRTLREQWRLADQGGIPNHGLWHRFDEACNEAHKFVETWLDEIKAKSAAVIAQRKALIEAVKAFGLAQTSTALEPNGADSENTAVASSPDWRALQRGLQLLAQQWREAGHLGERDFEALQTEWKAAIKSASAPLVEAQKQTLAIRHALIDEAKAMAESVSQGADLRIDAVRHLQQRWQAQAQTIPLDRKFEQKLWDQFKASVDQIFANKTEARQVAKDAFLKSMSQHDKAVLDASRALEAANALADARKIQAALLELEAALQGQVTIHASPQAAATSEAAPVSSEAAPASPEDSAAEEASAPVVAPVVKIAKPVIAMRGDDRQSAKIPEATKFAKGGDSRRQSSGMGRSSTANAAMAKSNKSDAPLAKKTMASEPRFSREARPPRLSDAAFHAQRQAREQAELVLKKLHQQAHGEVVSAVLNAWQVRTAEQLPTAQLLGKAVSNSARTLWAQALESIPIKDEASVALLRLEMASGASTPAAHLEDRRALQLLLLTKRHDPTPAQTWVQDVAKVLASLYNADNAQRLQTNLKLLLKK